MASRRLAPSAVDHTVYPTEDDVGENTLQRDIVTELLVLLRAWLAPRGLARVGADQFIYWRRGDPTAVVSPDVYVLPGVAPATAFGCWKVWETGIAPSFAFEVVSSDWRKDYHDVPQRHRALGVAELVIFDPIWNGTRHEPVRWQVWRRDDRRFVRATATDGDRVYVRALGVWLRVVGAGDMQRVRLATGPRGRDLVPTVAEERDAERAARDVERRVAAAEVQRLRRELARLRGG